jgi:hypothetical protein
VQLTNYGGISLSVIRASNLIEMQVNESCSRLIRELYEWYTKHRINAKQIDDNDAKEIDESQPNSKKIRLL